MKTAEKRAARFAAIVETYGQGHGERDGALTDRYLMVCLRDGDYVYTSHPSLSAAIASIKDDLPPHLFVDLDTGAQWDPVLTWTAQPRAGEEPTIQATDENRLAFKVRVVVKDGSWWLHDKHGHTYERDESGDGGDLLGFRDVNDGEPIAVKRADWIAVGGVA